MSAQQQHSTSPPGIGQVTGEAGLPGAIAIAAVTSHGAAYGLATLAQLMRWDTGLKVRSQHWPERFEAPAELRLRGRHPVAHPFPRALPAVLMSPTRGVSALYLSGGRTLTRAE